MYHCISIFSTFLLHIHTFSTFANTSSNHFYVYLLWFFYILCVLRVHTLIRIIFMSTFCVPRHFTALSSSRRSYFISAFPHVILIIFLCISTFFRSYFEDADSNYFCDFQVIFSFILSSPRSYFIFARFLRLQHFFQSFVRLPSPFHVISRVIHLLCVIFSSLHVHTLNRIILMSTFCVPRHFTFPYPYSNHFPVFHVISTFFCSYSISAFEDELFLRLPAEYLPRHFTAFRVLSSPCSYWIFSPFLRSPTPLPIILTFSCSVLRHFIAFFYLLCVLFSYMCVHTVFRIIFLSTFCVSLHFYVFPSSRRSACLYIPSVFHVICGHPTAA